MTSRQDHPQNALEMPEPAEALIQMVIGYRTSQALYVAAKLGIADLLKDGPKRSEELATAVGAHPDALYRVLHALTSVGVFAEDDHRGFTLTPLAALLQTDTPGSLRAQAIVFGEEWVWRPWGELLYTVKTGKPSFEHVFGTGIFTYFAQHAEAAQVAHAFLTAETMRAGMAVAGGYDFSRFHTIVDVGGGQGGLLAAVLKANPQMRGTLFDLPHVINGARSLLEAEGVAERCQLVAGDFFASVPGGADAYILRMVIHDWDDERAATILKSCRRAMGEEGKLLVVERVIPPGSKPFSSYAKLADLEMLVMDGGRERTEADYRALYAAAGFKLTNILPTQTPAWNHFSVIEGVCA